MPARGGFVANVLDMCTYMYTLVTIHTRSSTPYLLRVYTRIILASRNSCPEIDPDVGRNLDAHEAPESHACVLSRKISDRIIAPKHCNYKLLTRRRDRAVLHSYCVHLIARSRGKIVTTR